MTTIKPARRWLQFSLRSLLLLTLAVALWLGYEVRQARKVERTIEAIRALGGDAECEPTGWSLLRLCRVPGFGQVIVRAELPGSVVEEGIDLLRDLGDECDIEIVYDGTFDPTPSWHRATEALGKSIRAGGRVPDFASPDEEAWKKSDRARMLGRVRERMIRAYPQTTEFWDEPDYWSWLFDFERLRYQPWFLPDGQMAELVIREHRYAVPGRQACFAALIVEDQCVSVRGFATDARHTHQQVVLVDLDGDGSLEIGFDGGGGIWGTDDRVRQLPGDSRDWLGIYKIEPNGFKSLLPNEKPDLP